MAAGIQPIIVDNGRDILDLLNEVSLALVYGGLAWGERAKAKAGRSPDPTLATAETSHRLISSVEELG